MISKGFVLAALLVSGVSLAASDPAPCTLSVSGNTRKVAKKLESMATAKGYRIVEAWDDARYALVGGRETCSVPGCGAAVYSVYYYAPVPADPRPGMKYDVAKFSDRRRAAALDEMSAKLPECRDLETSPAPESP